MTGFEISRFVGLTEFQKTFMSCGICLGIMNEPIETQCRHTFCKFCIEEWIKKKKSCPECRQQLGKKRKRGSDVEYYSETSKKYSDMFSVLDIRCGFEGCHKIIKLENLELHSEECNFNKCIVCELRMGKKSVHNCIELLKKVWKNYENAYKKLTNSLTEERKKVSEKENQLKVENEKYRQLENEINNNSVEKDIKLMELKLELTVTNDEKSKIIETNNKMTEENNNLTKTLTEKSNKVLELENELKYEKQRNDKYEELENEMIVKMNEMEKSYQELVQKVTDSQNINQKLKTENKSITKEMNKLENQLKNVESDNNRLKTIEKVKQTENEINGKIIEMQNEIKRLKDENNNMKNNEKDLIESKLENHRVMELNKKFENDIKELEKTLNESKAQYKSLISYYDFSTSCSNESYIKRIKEIENKLITSETENKRLKGIEKDLNEMTESENIKNSKIDALMKEMNEIKKQNTTEVKDHKNNPMKTLRNRIKELEEEIMNLKNSIKELEEENVDLKKANDQYMNGLVERNNCHLGEYSGTPLKGNQNKSESKAYNNSGDNFIDLVETSEDSQLIETLQEKLNKRDFEIRQFVDNEDNEENEAKDYREIVDKLEVEKENIKKMILHIYEKS